ncbi:MAG: SDR family NAD(P)-dependent oxidoreductase [Chthoniobacterales bacterium]
MRFSPVNRPWLWSAAGLLGGAWLLTRFAGSRYSFAGKVVLITGGSRGLGLVLARQIYREGARVALLARKGDELLRAKQELGDDILTLECDLRDRGQIDNAVRTTADHFGGIDVVINNAGVIEVGPYEHMSCEDYERAMAVHFWAPYHVTMAALPHLRRRPEARIVNITSIGGKIAVPHLAPYCASKFAAVGFSDSVRSELARERIYITTVVPGMMRTGSHVNAQFKGNHGAEFSWFAASAGLPFLSISTDRAAAAILRACKRGRPFLGFPLSTKFAIAVNGLAPNMTARALNIAARLLPRATDSSGNELRSGWQSRADSGVPRWATHFADRNIERNNESNGTRG